MSEQKDADRKIVYSSRNEFMNDERDMCAFTKRSPEKNGKCNNRSMSW